MTGVDIGHGFRALDYGPVTSTNDIARSLADAGEAAGLFVCAEAQTAGRGRHGRSWQSPPGNLHASLILRPRRPMAEIATLSLVTALALAQAVEALSAGAVRPRLKWPNDVLIDGAKLAGILLEGASDGRGGCQWLIIGTGVNVTASPGDAVPYPTTNLVAAGLPTVTPTLLLAAMAAALRPLLDRWEGAGFAGLRQAWQERAAGVGSAVEMRLGEQAVRGRMLEIDDTGAIRLETAAGTVERFTAGEVVLG